MAENTHRITPPEPRIAFHKTELQPIRIEKQPHLANMQGQYVVYGQAGQVLRRGRELSQVLRVFDRSRFRVIE